ncbi:hypothetical protein [Maledivibacter halophilus]|uniref:Uncharacterized protein n=1 Tax=Maledivibacter halophilus TaxID=36842 RepID=A0A1T5K5M7_9FIRM|nr:hypothetical protein [Maledivibacter halophilus]SKC58768.1 hypothetical protein SAMN02194393_01625 [Maledivibacter halophilus]
MEDLTNFSENEDKKIKEESSSKIFGLDKELLLPIMFIFMINQNGTDFPIMDNIKKRVNELTDMLFNMQLSTQDIDNAMNMVDSVSPYMNSDNSLMLNKLSNFLSAMHKISTVKEFGSDMARSSSDGSQKPVKFKNQRQKALHMLGALEQFMDEPTKKNMQNFKNTITMLDKFDEVNKTMNEKRKNGGNMGIKDMIQLVGPMLGNIGGKNFPNAEKIDSMIRMMQIMSALDESDLDSQGTESKVEEEDEGGFFEFVIDRYDDEEDEE